MGAVKGSRRKRNAGRGKEREGWEGGSGTQIRLISSHLCCALPHFCTLQGDAIYNGKWKFMS